MNRKTSRYLVPLMLIFGLIFAAVVSAAPEAPTVAPQVCIGFQGARSNDEPVRWVVTQGGTRYTSQNEAVITADGTATGKFAVTGQPNTSYTLEIKASDSISYTHNSPTPFPAADGGDCSIDLSSVRLQEGDADGNGFVEASDLNRWSARFRNPVECAGDAGYDAISTSADFNEDACITAFDFNLWSANFGARAVVVPDDLTPTSSSRTATAIRGETRNYASTATSFNIVGDFTTDATGGPYSTVQVEMTFDPAKVEVTGFSPSADFPTIGSQTVDNTNGNFRVVVTLSGGGGNTGDDVDIVTVNINVLDDSTPQTFQFIPFNAGPPASGTHALDNQFNPAEGFGTYDRIGIANSTAVSMSDYGIGQSQTMVALVIVVSALGVATLVVTRTARRQD